MSAISSSDNSKMSSAAKTAAKTSKAATAPAAPAPAKAPKAPKATPDPVAAAAPVVEAAAPKTRGKKAAAVAAPAAPVSSDATAVAAPVAEEDLATKLANALKRQGEIAHQQKQLVAESISNAKEIEKLAARMAKKASGRRKRAEGSTSNNGKAFKTPVPITNDLAAFLGLEKGALISRSEVSKRIYAYAKAHNLQKGKVINTDASLRKLLGVTEKDEITILNLQKYINKHYIKPAPVAAN